jgi:hypothetical protein
MNLGKIDALIQVSQTFEPDSVHLNPTSGKLFVNAILFNAEAFFNAEVIDLDKDTSKSMEEETTTTARLETFRKMDPK